MLLKFPRHCVYECGPRLSGFSETTNTPQNWNLADAWRRLSEVLFSNSQKFQMKSKHRFVNVCSAIVSITALNRERESQPLQIHIAQ